MNFIVADLYAVRRPSPTQGCRADDDDDVLRTMPLS